MMANPANRHLSWARFEQLIELGPPAVELASGEPLVEIFTDAGGARIGFRTPTTDESCTPSPLVEIGIRHLQREGTNLLEVSTANRALYRDFYAFACAVADRIQIDQLPPTAAVDAALDAWAALLQRLALLSDERQTGLFGELWLAQRLAASMGWTNALEAWKGTGAEEHDFSLKDCDVEVKSTLSESRVHMIGSVTQLLPTEGRPLFVLSLQFTGAGSGSGQSLAEAVACARDLAAAESESALRLLDHRLKRSGWRSEHAPHYLTRLTARTAPCLVPVDDNCPAITPNLLVGLGGERLARIGQVAYRVDLSGLGYEDGSEDFCTYIYGEVTK